MHLVYKDEPKDIQALSEMFVRAVRSHCIANVFEGPAMPHYYFHLVEGEQTHRDDEGERHASRDAATLRASELLREFHSEFGPAISRWINVVDSTGALVVRVAD